MSAWLAGKCCGLAETEGVAERPDSAWLSSSSSSSPSLSSSSGPSESSPSESCLSALPALPRSPLGEKQLDEQKEQEELYNVAQLILTHSYKRARFYLENSPRNFNFSQSFTKSFHRWHSVTFSL